MRVGTAFSQFTRRLTMFTFTFVIYRNIGKDVLTIPKNDSVYINSILGLDSDGYFDCNNLPTLDVQLHLDSRILLSIPPLVYVKVTNVTFDGATKSWCTSRFTVGKNEGQWEIGLPLFKRYVGVFDIERKLMGFAFCRE